MTKEQIVILVVALAGVNVALFALLGFLDWRRTKRQLKEHARPESLEPTSDPFHGEQP